MTEQIQRKLSESKTARWSVLALVAFTMLCGYFITDMMAPLQDLLQTPVEGGGLGWTANEYGKFTSAYGWFNVFFLMLIFGGMILDKMGVRFTGLMATSIMLIGVFIKWFGISHNFDGATVTVFGSEYGYPLVIASLGYALFGVGVEIAGITVSKIIVKWFKGKEMALAMGLEMACARIGTGLAIGVTPLLSRAFGNILLTPFFGNLYDRKGKGATIMIIGSIMLIFIHFTFSIPMLDNWLVALILILLLGIAFSLVPSAMWPSVPKIIPENKLGTAYALIFWVQNWGLMGVPYIIGIVLDQYCISGEINGKPTYDYTIPMLIFTGFGVLALVISLLLKREDRIKGYGLELPNIQKDADKVLAEEMIGEGQR